MQEKELNLLLRRVERLIEEINLKAPSIIIDNEIRLIDEILDKIKQEQNNKNK